MPRAASQGVHRPRFDTLDYEAETAELSVPFELVRRKQPPKRRPLILDVDQLADLLKPSPPASFRLPRLSQLVREHHQQRTRRRLALLVLGLVAVVLAVGAFALPDRARGVFSLTKAKVARLVAR